MKLQRSLRSSLLASSALLCIHAHAAQLYWDGGTVNIGTNGNGVSGGAGGNWNTALTNWDQGNALAHIAWNNSNLDTAVFGGTAGTVSLIAPITVGGLRFDTTGYTIAASTHGLTFGTGTNTILFGNYSAATAAATISGTVTGTGSVILTNSIPSNSGVLTFNGTSTGGWSGATTVNAGMTLALAASSQALLNTSGITLNGGNITLTNTTGSAVENDRVSGSAITANGGTFGLTNTSGAGVYAETIGSVALTSGQTNFVFNTNAAGAGSQTLTLGGLTRPGTTSAVTFSSAIGLNTTKNIMVVTGAGGATPTGQIVGPWATTGNTSTQTDYAVYDVSNRVLGAGIAASVQTGWMIAANAYTADATPSTGIAGSFTLAGGTKNITALRSISASTATTADIATDFITQTSHVYANGDAVVFNNGTLPTGLTLGTVYFVRDVSGSTFKVAATQGGTAIDLTVSNGSGITALGALLVSTGNNLGTTGILNGSANTMYIAAVAGGSGAVTLPTTIADNLHVTAGAGPIVISAPITNNTGALTLVKNGSNALTLSGNNTFTGGIVNNAGTTTLSGTNTFGSGGFTINGGTLSVTTAAAWGGTGRNVTFGPGAGTLSSSVVYATGGTLTVSAGASGTILAAAAAAAPTFTTTTGSGLLIYTGAAASTAALSLGNASAFTGDLRVLFTGTNTRAKIQFNSIADTAGSVLQYLVGTTDSGQFLSFALTGNAGDLTFNNRSIEILQRNASAQGVARSILENNNGNTNGKWVINTDLLYHQNQARQFELGGTNTQDNKFAGVISNGDGGGTLGLNKVGAGKWILSGNNTYSDATTISGGTLNIQHANALGATSGNTSVADATTLQLQGGISFAAEPLTMAATSTGVTRLQSVSGNNTWNGPITVTGSSNFVRIGSDADLLTLAGTITGSVGAGFVVQGASGIAVTGQITGAGNVISGSVGAGPASIRTLSNATNNYTGATSITGGTLVGIGANAFGSTTGISIAAIGTLSLRGDASTSFVKVSDSSPYTVSTTASDATINVDQATVAGTSAKTMSIGAVGTTSVAATYEVNFTGANNTSLSMGAVTGPVSTAVASVDIDNSIASGGNPTLTLASYTSANTSGGETLTFKGTGNTTVTGAVTPSSTALALTKSGAGTLLLNGTNTYSGLTTVNAGTLGGTGTIAGSVTVDAAGSLAPGASAGILSIGLGLDVTAMASGTGKLKFELGANTATSDQLAVGGALTTGGALGFSDFTFTNLPGGPQNGTYTLITTGADPTGTLDGSNLSGTIGVGGTGILSVSGNNIFMTVSGLGGASPYDTWATSKGLTGGPGSSTDPAKNADPDNDGRNNLGEFAFNGDPLSGSDNGKIFVMTEDSDYVADPSSAEELILTVAVRTGTAVFAGSPSPSAIQAADGITYSIEGSLDLAGFSTVVNVVPTPVVPITPSAGAGYEYRSFSLDGSNGLAGKGFLRAKVTSP